MWSLNPCSCHQSCLSRTLPSTLSACAGGPRCHPVSLKQPGSPWVFAGCPVPCVMMDIVSSPPRPGGGTLICSCPNMCVCWPHPAQLFARPSLDQVPTTRTGSAPHIHLRHQPGDLWSLSPVARERIFKKTHRHAIKISVLGFGEGAGRLPPLLSGNTDFWCLKVTEG